MAALAALAYWGFHEFGGVAQWMIGLGATCSWRWCGARSCRRRPRVRRWIRCDCDRAPVFGAGRGLFAADAPTLAVIFAVLAGLHLGLTFALGSAAGARARPRRRPADARARARPEPSASSSPISGANLKRLAPARTSTRRSARPRTRRRPRAGCSSCRAGRSTGSGSSPGIAALDIGAEPRERLVDRRLVLRAEPDRVLAPVRHRCGVDDLAVRARPVLEAGKRRARLAHAE